MNYETGFAREEFQDYLKSSHDISERETEMIDNIISYALNNKAHTCDEVAYFVSDMIPDVEFKEVAGFCEDKNLTRNGLAEKQEFLSEHPEYQEQEHEI